MAELFADQDRLDDLLKEVPKELTAKLRQARQVQSKVARQIPTLERKRADGEKLLEQIGGAIDDLRQLGEEGSDQLASQLESAAEAVESAAQTLTSDAEGIVSEVDGVESGADTLRSALGDLGSRTGGAAQAVTASLSSFEENARAAMSGLESAGQEVQGATQGLSQAVGEAQQAVAGAVEALRQRISEMVSSAGASAASTTESFGQLADQHRSSLEGLGGRLSEWTTATAEDTQQRITGDVEAPLTERLQQIPGLIQEIESLLTELGETGENAGEHFADGFTTLRERAQSGRQLAEQVVELATSLNV